MFQVALQGCCPPRGTRWRVIKHLALCCHVAPVSEAHASPQLGDSMDSCTWAVKRAHNSADHSLWARAGQVALSPAKGVLNRSPCAQQTPWERTRSISVGLPPWQSSLINPAVIFHKAQNPLPNVSPLCRRQKLAIKTGKRAETR